MNKIQVITKIPNVDIDKEDGNLYHEILIRGRDNTNNCQIWRPFIDNKLMKKSNGRKNYTEIMLEVFKLGEIIIVNEIGREIGGYMRKADKWSVEYKEFNLKNINKAIILSKKIYEKTR